MVSEKTFILPHFLTPKNYFFEAFWKQMPVYFCIFTSENFCFKDVIRFNLVVGGGRLNNFLKAARFLDLVKCFTIFHFNCNFWKFNYFLVFWYFHQYYWNAKIFQTIWTSKVRWPNSLERLLSLSVKQYDNKITN